LVEGYSIMIAVVDSGVANLRSVSNALHHLGAEMKIAHTPDDLHGADKIILPGVGAFSAGMEQLHKRGFVQPLQALAHEGVPILGICLGMQLLFERSEEMGHTEGLGLLPGAIVRFPTDGPKVPHIGWNQLAHDGHSPLLKDVPVGGYAYFVHSFYAAIPTVDMVIATTDYGIDFPAVVGRGNVFGAQFHPEKSQHTGLKLLSNFMEM
jgi:imidazole glycerol-phosphate synthase subunit HisH